MSDQLAVRHSVSDIERMAAAMAKSGLFGVKTADQALALMLIAQAEGIHPAAAVRKYHVIQGRAALKSDSMLSGFIARGGKVKWVERTDAAVEATFISVGCPDGVTIRWTLDDAKRAGLLNKDNWWQYPRQMLTARVISEGVRAADPGVVEGVYTPEEISDYATPVTAIPKFTKAEVVAPQLPPPVEKPQPQPQPTTPVPQVKAEPVQPDLTAGSEEDDIVRKVTAIFGGKAQDEVPPSIQPDGTSSITMDVEEQPFNDAGSSLPECDDGEELVIEIPEAVTKKGKRVGIKTSVGWLNTFSMSIHDQAQSARGSGKHLAIYYRNKPWTGKDGKQMTSLDITRVVEA